jgi:hypothetical protein
MSATRRYRIWLRGAFPKVVPQHVDRNFTSTRAAIVHAYALVLKSVAAAGTGPSFTSYTVHGLSERGGESAALVTWRAGD